MNRRQVVTFLGTLLITLIVSVGFRVVSSIPSQAQSTALLVAAAASLQNALEELDPIFEESNSGITVNYTFAASGALQQQIQQGAPVDVFISAATQQMDALQEQGLILAGTRRNLLTNQLVLIVPNDSPLKISDFQQLTNPTVRKISMGEPRSVPAGAYTKQLSSNLGILEQLQPKFVYGNSVRSILSTVESGNADAGVVYATDAKISNRVRQVAIAPSNLHSPIVYPIAMIQASQNQQAARAYIQFLSSLSAQNVFKKHGFGIAQ
ncbi:MAG: molybdate ABC transporter substrate-binding protein [Cyanobacteria bacterium RM1_2_2]|nr:molybdate ABC transporter substrate-binding protein [Cyanobacteria bacterium RM1_2_2]